MSDKVKINIEDIRKLIKKVNKFEELKFDNIEWYENGEKMFFKPECIDEWRFTGLGNISFVELEGWNLIDE